MSVFESYQASQLGLISLLPQEVVLRIFSFLNVRDLKVIAFVCRFFHVLSSDNQIWKEKTEDQFDVCVAKVTKEFNNNWKETYQVLEVNFSKISYLMRKEITTEHGFSETMYIHLIQLCNKSSDTSSQAFNRFYQMINMKLRPPIVAYTYLIHACLRKQDLPKAYYIFKYMISRQIQPSSSTYTRLVDACVKIGDIEKARQIANMHVKK